MQAIDYNDTSLRTETKLGEMNCAHAVAGRNIKSVVEDLQTKLSSNFSAFGNIFQKTIDNRKSICYNSSDIESLSCKMPLCGCKKRTSFARE